MNKFEIFNSIIDDKEKFGKNNKEQWLYYYCPFCGHYKPKLAINTKTGKWHCWVCESNGNGLKNLYYKVKNNGNKNNSELNSYYSDIKKIHEEANFKKTKYNGFSLYISTRSTNEKIKLPKFTKKLDNKSIITNKFYYYLTNDRKLSPYIINKYNIMYNEKRNSIIVPSINEKNKIDYYVEKLNIFNKRFSRYTNPNIPSDSIIFNEKFINYNWPIILVEGVFDSLTLNFNAIPILGKKIPSALLMKLIKKNYKHTIYIYLDGDAEKDAYRLSKKLNSYGLTNNKIINLKDKNLDINNMGFELSIKKLYENQNDYSFYNEINMLLNN